MLIAEGAALRSQYCDAPGSVAASVEQSSDNIPEIVTFSPTFVAVQKTKEAAKEVAAATKELAEKTAEVAKEVTARTKEFAVEAKERIKEAVRDAKN